MQVIMSAIGSAGDVHPMVGIGARLRERGCQVAIITNPYFEDLVARLGLEMIPVQTREQFEEAIQNPDLWHPTRAFPYVAEFGILGIMRDVYEIVSQRYVPGETIVTAHLLDVGSRLAQEKFGFRMATLDIAPVMMRSVHVPPVLPMTVSANWAPAWLSRLQWWLADKLVVDRVLCPRLNEFRSELGLPPIRRPMNGWWHSPDRVLGLYPDWYAPPQPDWPKQFVATGFPQFDESGLAEIPNEVANFLKHGSPPIVFTPGSANIHAREFFEAAVDACRRSEMRGMLLTRHSEQIPAELPDGVRHFDYVPLSYALPRSAAMVHHGGVGTTGQGLKAGVPHLVMPLAHDQFDNSARLQRLGVGEELRPRWFSGRRVAAAIERLISSPSVALATRTCADRLENVDAIGLACDQIEALAQ